MKRWEVTRNRTQAQEKGIKYFVGNACKICGATKRYTKSGNCVECAKGRAKKIYREAVAANNGIVYYGSPCAIHGDVGRYVGGYHCVECTKERQRAKRRIYDGKTKGALNFAARVKKWITYKDVTGSVGLIAELYNLCNPTTARKRFDKGLPLEKVFAPTVPRTKRPKPTKPKLTPAGRMFAAHKSKWVTYRDVTGSMQLIVEMYGAVGYGTFNSRRQAGWSIAEALLVPRNQHRDNFVVKAQIQTALERRALREKQNDIRPVLQANLCIA